MSYPTGNPNATHSGCMSEAGADPKADERTPGGAICPIDMSQAHKIVVAYLLEEWMQSAPSRKSSKLQAASVSESPAAKPRRRRRAGQVQVLILEAARRTFAEKGYARTTTRAIAARAAVAEPLLFRKFGSKAKLFAEAVLHPMAQFIREWIDEMPESLPAATTEEAQR